MGALKLSSDVQEKQRLKAQCRDIMNAADRIKNDANWRPAAKVHQEDSKGLNVNQWAADVVSAQSPSDRSEGTAEQASSSQLRVLSTTAPLDNASDSSGKYISSCTSFTGRNAPVQRDEFSENYMHNPHVTLIDLSNNHFPTSAEFGKCTTTDSWHEDRPQPVFQPALEKYQPPVAHISVLPQPEDALLDDTSTPRAKAFSSSPSTAPYSQIHRLAEPFSSRKRSKREDIILLKASMVNGFKCPPWDRNPLPDEFLGDKNTELFKYVDVFLSFFLLMTNVLQRHT